MLEFCLIYFVDISGGKKAFDNIEWLFLFLFSLPSWINLNSSSSFQKGPPSAKFSNVQDVILKGKWRHVVIFLGIECCARHTQYYISSLSLNAVKTCYNQFRTRKYGEQQQLLITCPNVKWFHSFPGIIDKAGHLMNILLASFTRSVRQVMRPRFFVPCFHGPRA